MRREFLSLPGFQTPDRRDARNEQKQRVAHQPYGIEIRNVSQTSGSFDYLTFVFVFRRMRVNHDAVRPGEACPPV